MNNLLRRYLFVVFFLVVGVLYATAQVRLSGRIVDENRESLEAAVVMLLAEKDSVLVSTVITDEQGRFSLKANVGTYVVCARYLGYADGRQRVELSGDKQLADMVMVPMASDLKEVVVTAKHRRPLAKMDGGKLQIDVAKSYLTDLGNALEVLRHSPGISVSRQGDIALSTLGGTALYVNGKRIRMQGEELAAYLRSLSSARIARVEASALPDARYDADGAGGIINIVLKSNDMHGFSLTTSHGLAYWDNLRTTSDVALSYQSGQWQLGVNYNHALGHYAMNYGTDKIQDGIKNISYTDDEDMRNTYAAGIDVVWQPNERHKLALNTSFNLLEGPGITETTTKIFDAAGTLDKILLAKNDYVKQHNPRYGGSVIYEFMPSARRSLALSLDYIKFKGHSRCDQPNRYLTAQSVPLYTENYYSEPRKDIDIYSLKVDYRHGLKKGEVLAGIKTSAIESDNKFRFEKNGQLDDLRSNSFDYRETNVDGYLQCTFNLGQWQLSGGGRLEYMRTKGELLSYKKESEVNRIDRIRFFPNLSLAWQLGEQMKLSAQYGRRQDKPKYEDLNPFEYLLDELFYWKGNPFLVPQISDKLLLGFSLKSFSVNLFYNHLSDYFVGLTDVYGEGKAVMTIKNVGKQSQWGMEMVYSGRLLPWWDVSSNIGLYHFTNNLDYETFHERYRRPSLTLSVNNDISLPGKVRMELSARYYSKRQGGSYEVAKSHGNVDVGFSRAFLKDKLRLSLLMTDIFHTERWDSYGQKDALNLKIWGYGETRQVMFKASYSLGSFKLKTRHESIEELNRL